MNERIFLSPPHMGGDEIKLIHEAFDQNWVSPAGPHITAFEQELADFLGENTAVAALSSGTAAIHLALVILGVEQGDEVLCSSFTFSGTCNPILYQRAIPVFVDSERETWNMDPNLLREAIESGITRGKKPKAIIVVHLYGMPAKMKELMTVAKEFEIPVIEDAAEALGSTYEGRQCGTFGDFGILSFNGNKIITTSGGGALVSKNAKWIEKARFLATQARDPAPYYLHSHVGYNYRLSNVSAAIGRGQLRVLEDRIRQRQQVFSFYKEAFNKYNFISFQPECAGNKSNRWLSCILFEESARIQPESIRQYLECHNVETRPLWNPMHRQPVFQTFKMFSNGVSDNLFSRGLCLPSGSSMTVDKLELVSSKTIMKLTQMMDEAV